MAAVSTVHALIRPITTHDSPHRTDAKNGIGMNVPFPIPISTPLNA